MTAKQRDHGQGGSASETETIPQTANPEPPIVERISASEVAHLATLKEQADTLQAQIAGVYGHILRFYRLDQRLDRLDEETGIITRGAPPPVAPPVPDAVPATEG